MSKIVTFTVSIEVEDDGIEGFSDEEKDLFDQMLSDMEEVVGKSPFSLDDSYCEDEDQLIIKRSQYERRKPMLEDLRKRLEELHEKLQTAAEKKEGHTLTSQDVDDLHNYLSAFLYD